MKLSEVCIKKPVLSWVLTFFIVLLGLVGYQRLPMQQFPQIERASLKIETELPGAGAEVVENSVTRVLEDRLASIDGIDLIQSSSLTEKSEIILHGHKSKKLKDLKFDVLEAVNDAKRDMPEALPPRIKAESGESSVAVLVLRGKEFDLGELAEFARHEIEKDLDSIEGVSSVTVSGAGNFQMHVYLDPGKLSAHKFSVIDVVEAIKRNNFEKPAGHIITGDRQYVVTTVSNLEKPVQFENMPIGQRDGHIIYVRDVGHVEMSPEEKRTRSKFNGERIISISVHKQPTANPIKIADAIEKQMPKIKDRLKSGMELEIGIDHSKHIRKSIHEVYETIFEAIFLVVLVIFLFLRSFNASIIPIITIPISLIGTFFVMYVLGFTINMFTLTAMFLAVGLVVDDAIVVLENIHRYIKRGLSVTAASFKGIREISTAIIAMTLTLAAVYAPIGMAEGDTGKYLIEFAITLTSAVIISGFVALTLSPMMCSRILLSHEEEKHPNKYQRLFDKLVPMEEWLKKLETIYKKYLTKILKKKFLLIFSVFFVFIPIVFGLYRFIPNAFLPKEDRGTFQVKGYASANSTIEYTDRYVNQLDKILEDTPEVEKRVVMIETPTTYKINVTLKEKRKRTTDEVIKEVKEKFNDIIGIYAGVEAQAEAQESEKLEFVIRGHKPIEQLSNYASLMGRELMQTGFFSGYAMTSQHAPNLQYVITIDPSSQTVRVDPTTIAETINALIKGKKSTQFNKENKRYDVMVEVEDKHRQNLQSITNLYVKTQARDKRRDESLRVPLGELISIKSKMGYPSIIHYKRTRAMDQFYPLKKGSDLKTVIKKVDEIRKKVLPQDIHFEFIGSTKKYLEESNTMFVIIIMALLFIYLVMAAQFESWRDPFIIMFSVPVALCGGVLAVNLMKHPLITLYGFIGFLTLIGLITKHGIMMVAFANQLRHEKKYSIHDSIVEASQIRLRPILMTTAAMTLGVFPMLFTTGSTAASRFELSSVLVGGLLVGTFLTLFVVPCMYTLIAKRKLKEISLKE